MPRIIPVDRDAAAPKTAEILDAVGKKMGMVPNLISTMAQSPAVVNAYLGFSQALGGGNLPSRLREQIALAVGEANSCDYCLAAHTALGKRTGLQDEDVLAARQGKSSRHKETVALEFAQKLVAQHGNVSDADVASLRAAEFSDGEICEIIANVALNIFTNYFNQVAETEVDFPVASSLATA